MRRLGATLTAVALVALIGTAAAAWAAPRLADVSREAHVFYPNVKTWSAEAGDVNRDGWDDLLVSNHFKPINLYRNQRDGTFSRAVVGNRRDRHDCVFGDVNRDGREDFYCAIGGGKGRRLNSNELWIQRPDGGFENRADRYDVTDRRGRGRDVAFLDANGDGFLDLYVGNEPGRRDEFVSRNKLFLSVNGNRFKRAPASWHINRGIGAQIVQAIDYNGDRRPDLFVCGEHRAHLYRNVRGRRYRDVSRGAGVDMPCEGGVIAAMDGDRRPDVVIASRTRLKVMHQRGNGTFKLVENRRLHGGTEVVAGLVDSDARPDLYVVQRGRPDADERDLMLLNRRGGRRFRSIRIPQTRKGKGDYAISLDYDRNGRADLLVMNGFHKQRGPVRLLATRPQP
ncbi:MAG: FG-GAP repeat domain-containing protein [Thermoleophilaceae bacterium]